MEIKLGGKRGGVTLVSPEDYEEVSKYSWFQDDEGYVRGTVNNNPNGLSRFITNAEEDEIVDHMNGNTLDNRKENLKRTNTQKNAENRSISKSKKSSKYRGVFYQKKAKKYTVEIRHDKTDHYLGRYDDEVTAAEVFDMYIVHNKLDHIRLNFPDKKEEYSNRKYIEFQSKQYINNYYGVSKTSNSYNKYKAEIKNNKKKVYICSAPTELECAIKYDEYIIKNNIPNKQLNFPDKFPNYKPVQEIKTMCDELDTNTVRLLIKSDGCVKIDKEDYDKIKYYICYVGNKGYIYISIDRELKLLSRFLMQVSDPKIFIDHEDSDILNNTKLNLRISNVQKNGQNKSRRVDSSSKYISVYYNKKQKKWETNIVKNNKNIFNKKYDDEEYAARSRDIFILENLKDDHYKLNFKWNDREISEWKNKLSIVVSDVKQTTSSKYTGIYYVKNEYKWKARIVMNHKTVFQIENKSEELVARARDLYVLDNLNDTVYKYKLNFIWNQKDMCKWNMIINDKLNKNVDIKLLEEILEDDTNELNTIVEKIDDIEKQYDQLMKIINY